jgi:low temperature requirement protein LtrA
LPDSDGRVERVTTLELFFDLVFVFTITQLTTVLFRSPNTTALLQVVVMLTLIWWMYGGYAWLTNAVRADTGARRLLLLGGMAGYLILALAIPRAFSSSGLAFGLAYVGIVAVHTLLFTRSSSIGVVQAILTLARYNLGVAVVVAVGGALGGTVQYILWGGAALVEWVLPTIRRREGSFLIGASHFVERHGLVVIIAIGESVVAIGFGAGHLRIDAALVLVAVVGLALSACLWWLYFGEDLEPAERALSSLELEARARAALFAFGYWHLPMLLGIVAVAAAERTATAHAFTELSWTRAAYLGGGVAAYCAGDALFRRELALGRLGTRSVAALLAVATIPAGALVSPFVQLALLVFLLVMVFWIEGHIAATPFARVAS